MTTQGEFPRPMGVLEGDAKAATVKVEAGAARKARAHTRYVNKLGVRVPGTTTITNLLNKPHLVPWANRLGLEGIESGRYVDILADAGTLAHALIHEYLTGTSVNRRDYSPVQVELAENAFLKFLEWEKGKTCETVVAEEPLVSEAYQYGGTVDWYGKINGVPTLCDFKTSKAVYEEHFYQVAAYAQLLREHGHPVEDVRILQIGRDESEGFGDRPLTEEGLRFAVFRHLLGVYQLQRQIEGATAARVRAVAKAGG